MLCTTREQYKAVLGYLILAPHRGGHVLCPHSHPECIVNLQYITIIQWLWDIANDSDTCSAAQCCDMIRSIVNYILTNR